jgi:heterodisulfide reductase subunit D
MPAITEIIRQTRAYYCLDCGKCTGVCPVARINQSFSPRSLLMRSIQKDEDSLFKDKALWECLTCGRCEIHCPSQIEYIHFMRDVRSLSLNTGEKAECSHGGAFHSLMRIMTANELKQQRMDWIPGKLKTMKRGEVVYFVGCAPYFDAYFSDLKVDSINSAKGTIYLLNKVGVTPAILADERCCGHDLLWSGDIDNFKRLAEHNLKIIEESGAKIVVFSCPEGYQTFSQDYTHLFGKLNFQVVHITQLLSEAVKKGIIKFNYFDSAVTYQDPCRLGRHMGVYDAPRDIINSIPKIQFNEMIKNRQKSICCGVGNWLTCGSVAKTMQANRFREAKHVGAKTLITVCPKCEIHFKCALQDERLNKEVNLEIKDLMSLAATLVD